MRRWKPIAKKDFDFATLGRLDIALLVHADELAVEDSQPENYWSVLKPA